MKFSPGKTINSTWQLTPRGSCFYMAFDSTYYLPLPLLFHIKYASKIIFVMFYFVKTSNFFVKIVIQKLMCWIWCIFKERSFCIINQPLRLFLHISLIGLCNEDLVKYFKNLTKFTKSSFNTIWMHIFNPTSKLHRPIKEICNIWLFFRPTQ